MADSYTEVTKKSWGSNILDSMGGLLIGIVIFLLSFWVLWANEGTIDLSKIARTSLPVSLTQIDPAAEGKLVSVSGNMSTLERVDDPLFLQPGEYIKLLRKVEICAWQEKSKSQTKDKLGGGSETTTTYTYVKVWTADPKDSSKFKVPAGHENPALPVHNDIFVAGTAKLGLYTVDPRSMDLPAPAPIKLMTGQLREIEGQTLAGNYVFKGNGKIKAPAIGDIRVSYMAVPNNVSVTVFGKQSGEQLIPYIYNGTKKVYLAVKGTRDEAIATVASEHKARIWVMRIIGFLLMWGGLFLFLGPLNAILKVLPWLGTGGRWVAGIVTFPIALGLTLLTVIISMIAHNIWLLLGLIVVLGGLTYYSQKQKKKG
ncbi:MAG: TMEM43 family protein [Candidatus Margulisbacteria bacterium]|nr:TMEM43 family protein [Candidatus Margulisiibacteriota bacterium]